MVYRREIDGLRALAVVPVILFHAGFSLFAGGYVGVDVFFVISGFLITGIIIEEMRAGRFSLVGFYERRARRILPALFFVMAVSAPVAWALLSPRDLKDFAQSLVAISVFASNILFWLKSGYFDTAAELNPMLHTWSLAVEEQFYVVFPLLLMAAWRLGPRRLFALIVIFAVASLALSEWLTRTQPVTAFFLLPSRAWQLLVGAMAAFLLAFRVDHAALVRERRALSETLGLAGLVLVVVPMFLYDEHTPFPGLNAVAPTVGTALLLVFTAPQTTVGRVLCLRPLVAVGLVSYSAYLWHQPLFAFTRHAALGEVPAWVMAALVPVVFILAYLSWRFVEQPFRRRDGIGRRAVFAFTAAGIAAFGAAGAVGHLRSDRITEIRLAGVEPALRASFRTKDELVRGRDELLRPFRPIVEAPFSGAPGALRVLIVGDSVGNDMFGALMANADRFRGVEFRRLSLDDLCMPQFERALQGDVSGPPDIGDANTDCLEEALRLRDSSQFAEADVLVLNSYWRRRSTRAPHLGAISLAGALAGLGREVVVVGLLSMKDASSVAFLVLRDGLGFEEANAFAYRTLQRQAIDAANAAARTLAERDPRVRYLDKLSLFCDDDARSCRLFDAEGRLMFSDGHHLSAVGALWFGERLAERGWFAADAPERRAASD